MSSLRALKIKVDFKTYHFKKTQIGNGSDEVQITDSFVAKCSTAETGANVREICEQI